MPPRRASRSIRHVCSRSVAAVVSRVAGRATWYNPGLGACGHYNDGGDLVVALPSHVFRSQLCGARVDISSGGRTVQVTIADECPPCASGDLDLSQAAFTVLAPLSQGVIQVQWSIRGQPTAPGTTGPTKPKPKPTPKPVPTPSRCCRRAQSPGPKITQGSDVDADGEGRKH
ncbi:RlpA-like double-psi beta-barrel domain-containing protein [Micromonospora sp. NPDC050397]|uniref:RlpA-like double-psi beta-barrel domain-containing protein n=1 Tax=Micromonospora sp. NPDC050397 TaxID=3364279 RepID=UPI00384E51D3